MKKIIMVALIATALITGVTLYSLTSSTKTKAVNNTSVKYIFDDEFNGTKLDSSKWSVCFTGNNCTHSENQELECYTSNNISLKNSTLYLTAKKENKICTDGNSYNYTSALIQTDGKFSFTYGHVEIRAKTPTGVGFWPTFWLLPTDHSWPPELDVLEQVGGVTDTNFMSVHYGNNNQYVQQTYQGANFTAGYHTYGMDWQKDYVKFYVDNREVASYHNRYNVPNKPMYLILNLAVGGSATPAPNSQTVFPSSFNVQYVRVWK